MILSPLEQFNIVSLADISCPTDGFARFADTQAILLLYFVLNKALLLDPWPWLESNLNPCHLFTWPCQALQGALDPIWFAFEAFSSAPVMAFQGASRAVVLNNSWYSSSMISDWSPCAPWLAAPLGYSNSSTLQEQIHALGLGSWSSSLWLDISILVREAQLVINQLLNQILLNNAWLLASGGSSLDFILLDLNTSTLWVTLGACWLLWLFAVTGVGETQTRLIASNNWQLALEQLYSLVHNIVEENAGKNGRPYFPIIFTTFMMILICNVQGMIPYSFTVTSHLVVTFSMALSIFIGINILGILKNGSHFLCLFFPPGAPLALAPLLVLIELVSYVFRVLSLSIRLFANLMSGHTLLKILSAYAWLAVSAWGLFLVPLVIIFLVTGLELAIAFLQAYIFSVLLCIYINDAFDLH